MIPEEKKTVVQHALQSAFGTSEFEDIRQLTVGLSSALIFRVVVLGKPYLLRIITRTDAMGDPTQQFICMKPAVLAGLAPKVRYTSIEDRISITDFIDAKPFPLKVARQKMPDLLKRLHALPVFPCRIHYLDTMDGGVQKFKDAKILPESSMNELFELYSKIAPVYPRSPEDWVSCHNDCKPENIIYDGDRPWLVDWEAAFPNDCYSDLAVVGNFLVSNDEEEKDYLKRYFGEGVSEYHHARFFLMSQMMHMYYFSFYMLIVSATGKTIDLNSSKPDFREFHDQIWAGKISLADVDARLQYAWCHMQQLHYNLRLKRFDEALLIVSKQR